MRHLFRPLRRAVGVLLTKLRGDGGLEWLDRYVAILQLDYHSPGLAV